MTIVLTASLAVGVLLFVIALLFALAHPEHYIARFIPVGIPEQNQAAKTAVYVLTVLVLLPLSVVLVPRLGDRIARSPSAAALPGLTAMVPAGLGLAVVFTRISGSLPWGDGLWVLMAASGAWLMLTAVALRRAGAEDRPAAFGALVGRERQLGVLAAVAVLAGIFSVTKGLSLHPLPLVLAALTVVAVVLMAGRVIPAPGTHVRWRWLELVLAAVLVLAVVPAIVVQTSSTLPNLFVPPGIVQYHQDFLLGPTNQLLRGGGALMVNVPISQYGVGPIYLLYAVFHVLPIGYGSYGLLDGILTALFYIAGYCVLRAAGVRRLLGLCAIAVGLVALVYGLKYPVGELPQQGPLRFGLPMLVVVGLTLANRWPARATLGRTLAISAVGLSAVWAVETFVYTALTFGAMVAVEAVLMAAGERSRWLFRQALLVVGACAASHLVLAAWTVADTGHLPNWGEYGTYIREFLLGGGASRDTYGFERWSPVLAVACGTLGAAVSLAIVLRRATDLRARERPAMVALAGLTTFAAVLLSYSDNRSSTYLITYVALPLLMIVTLWLSLLLRQPATPPVLRTGALAVAAAVAAMLIAVAWPAIGSHFSRSLLAHAYPGGGFGGSIHQLLHSPPVDPRAPVGEALVNRYLPGRRVLVLTPLYPDLTTEILMRDGRASYFFSGDPKSDSYVPSIWTDKVGRQIDALPVGTRVLLDPSALRFLAAIRTQPNRDVVGHPLGLGDPEVEWVLQHLQRRFTFRPLYAGPHGFVIGQLLARPS